MNNLLSLSSCFFNEHTVDKWQAVRKAGITDVELSINSRLVENLLDYIDESEKQYNIIKEARMNITTRYIKTQKLPCKSVLRKVIKIIFCPIIFPSYHL